ncbi:hypothetical protein RP20_CCG009645 [Aedes albopictus]|nr:hypothetical protein RP20_CCG009645 [Aedes albopictus]
MRSKIIQTKKGNKNSFIHFQSDKKKTIITLSITQRNAYYEQQSGKHFPAHFHGNKFDTHRLRSRRY